MHLRVSRLLTVAVLTATIGAPQTSDKPGATPAGATFVVPKDWSSNTGASSVVLQPPETDSHVAIVDVQAADAAAAVSAAWNAYRPESKRPLKLSTSTPARNGWEERRHF